MTKIPRPANAEWRKPDFWIRLDSGNPRHLHKTKAADIISIRSDYFCNFGHLNQLHEGYKNPQLVIAT